MQVNHTRYFNFGIHDQ